MSTPPNTEIPVSEMPSCKSCGQHIPRIGHKCPGLKFKQGSTPKLPENYASGGWSTPTPLVYDLVPEVTETFVSSDLQKLVSRLENQMAEWVKYIEPYVEEDSREEAFDQGYLAGLRRAVNLAKEQESL